MEANLMFAVKSGLYPLDAGSCPFLTGSIKFLNGDSKDYEDSFEGLAPRNHAMRDSGQIRREIWLS
jgi:hypothetical protein